MVAEVSNFGVDDIAACMQQSWPPEPLELYSREALRATTDMVQAERWLLPSVGLHYWRRVQVLGRGVLGAANFTDPYLMCFVPMPDEHELIHTTVGSYPLIGGPRFFNHREVQRSTHGVVMDILKPWVALNKTD